MLHVLHAVSGAELADIRVEQQTYVRTVKAHLCEQYGFPLSLQQLLHDGSVLEDGVDLGMLAMPMELHLVLLPVSEKVLSVASELELAAEQGHVQQIRWLFETDAFKDLAPHHVERPFVIASQRGHVEVLQLFISAGATRQVDCAIQEASAAGHVEVVRLLVEAGADIGLDEDGYSFSLIIAAEAGHVEIVSFLLEARADVSFMDHLGGHAIADASEKGHARVVHLLLDAGADRDAALEAAASHGQAEIVRLLLQRGILGDEFRDQRQKASELALKKGHLEIVELLAG